MFLKTNRSSIPPSSQEEHPLDKFCHNEVFDVLGNQRRRYILYLLSRNGPTECREVAEQIAAWETDLKRDQVPSRQYQSVYNSLYQTHLPGLETAGLVEYDRSENLVYPTDQMAEIERFIDPDPRFNELSPRHLSALIGGILLVSGIGGTLALFSSGNIHLYAVSSNMSLYAGGTVLVFIATILIGAHVR